jgi:galactokinase
VEVSSRDLLDAHSARGYFKRHPEVSWAAYALGVVPILRQVKRLPMTGADLILDSSVPPAKGLASSAAVEVATMNALGRLFPLRFKGTELPRLAQQVENRVVGAPCGLMDQLTSHLGRKGRLLPIVCRPDRVGTPIPIPKGVRFVGVDSGVRHWVGGASYGGVRTAAYMGYSLIARSEGAGIKTLKRAKETGDASHLPFGGFLANIPPELFESRYRLILPERMTGREFLKRAVSIDRETVVTPDGMYPVLAATRHPVGENHRVGLFRDLLVGMSRGAGDRDIQLRALGAWMFESHLSYRACGLTEPVTDSIVEAAFSAGPKAGVYGAKITGGGSGGTVCLLVEGKNGLSTAGRIAARHSKSKHPFLTLGSSEGASWS